MSDEERLKISPKSKKQKMILSTEADTAIVGGAMGCLDGETEYLSESGWAKISDYTEGTVAQYNPDENIIEFPINEHNPTPKGVLYQTSNHSNKNFSSY